MVKGKVSPISPLNALKGLKHLFDEEKTIILKVTEKVFVPCVAKGDWICSRLPEWEEMLGKLPDLLVVKKVFLDRPRGNIIYQFGNYCPSKREFGYDSVTGHVVANLEVRGGVKTEPLVSEFKSVLFNAVKQWVALAILKECPLPFDGLNPLLPEGSLDLLRIESAWSHLPGSIADDHIKGKIQRAGAKIISAEKSEKGDYWLNIQWQSDISDDKRDHLAQGISDLIYKECGVIKSVTFGVH